MQTHKHTLLLLFCGAQGSVSGFQLAKVDEGRQEVIFNLLMCYGRLLLQWSIEGAGRQRKNVK